MRLPTYFISHGGGPWPWLDGPFRRMFDRLESSLRDIAAATPVPRAVLVVSGHWVASQFTVQSGRHPTMVYDYSGFPPHTYQIVYPAPGSPAIGARVHELLTTAGIPVADDGARGYDHGTFAPLYVMYPDAHASVPIVQLSLQRAYRPDAHLAVGRALAPLRDEGVLVMGSGLSWHNLRMIGAAARAPSNTFDDWLAQTLAAEPKTRTRQLLAWETAPAARIAHPEEDHFLPLMVAVGAAEHDPAYRVYLERDFMGGVTASSYGFGAGGL